MDFQLAIRPMRDCLDKWETSISEISNRVCALRALPRDEHELQEIAAGLGKICNEAHVWFFDDLHEMALMTECLVLDLQFGHLSWERHNIDRLSEMLGSLSNIVSNV